VNNPEFFLPEIPPCVPQLPTSWRQKICRQILKYSGWRITGQFPDKAKLVLIAAPHSSNWDAVWGLLFKLSLGVEIKFLIKQEALFWPFGTVLRKLGAVSVDRKAAHGIVEQMKIEFSTRKSFWLLIAPEGTRKKVKNWKSGFWNIARNANVPVLCIYFHYPEKIIGIGPLIELSDDLDKDMQLIREFYRPWQGKNRGSN